MRLRILPLSPLTIIIYLLFGIITPLNLLAQIDQACPDISGQWNLSQTGMATCSGLGVPLTYDLSSSSGPISINQLDCNISFTVPNSNTNIRGTINNDSLHISGILIDFPPDAGVVVTKNNIDLRGSIQNANPIVLTGNGEALGTYNDIPVTCTTNTIVASFSRDLPDLTVIDITLPNRAPITDQSFIIRSTVRNQGTANSSKTILRYYRSSDPIISTEDIQLSSDVVEALSPGDNSPKSQSVSISSTNNYWIGACVDPVKTELSTTNNCSTGIQITVKDPVSIIPIIQFLLDF